jgi:hypothetical protein
VRQTTVFLILTGNWNDQCRGETRSGQRTGETAQEAQPQYSSRSGAEADQARNKCTGVHHKCLVLV